MEVLRDTDGSVTFTFTTSELKRIKKGQIDIEVDGLAWKNLAAHFISYAQRHDPEGEFAFVEDFCRESGDTIGYTALRHPPLETNSSELPPVQFPKVNSELVADELESIRLPGQIIYTRMPEAV